MGRIFKKIKDKEVTSVSEINDEELLDEMLSMYPEELWEYLIGIKDYFPIDKLATHADGAPSKRDKTPSDLKFIRLIKGFLRMVEDGRNRPYPSS